MASSSEPAASAEKVDRSVSVAPLVLGDNPLGHFSCLPLEALDVPELAGEGRFELGEFFIGHSDWTCRARCWLSSTAV